MVPIVPRVRAFLSSVSDRSGFWWTFGAVFVAGLVVSRLLPSPAHSTLRSIDQRVGDLQIVQRQSLKRISNIEAELAEIRESSIRALGRLEGRVGAMDRSDDLDRVSEMLDEVAKGFGIDGEDAWRTLVSPDGESVHGSTEPVDKDPG